MDLGKLRVSKGDLPLLFAIQLAPEDLIKEVDSLVMSYSPILWRRCIKEAGLVLLAWCPQEYEMLTEEERRRLMDYDVGEAPKVEVSAITSCLLRNMPLKLVCIWRKEMDHFFAEEETDTYMSECFNENELS